MTSRQRTFLLVGAGSIGRRHLANLRVLEPRANIVVLRQYSRDPLAGADLVVSKLDDALMQQPFAAIIANPAPMHVPVAQRLAERGCHLLIEKPLSHDLDGVDFLLQTCAAQRLVLAIGYNLRFMPSLQRLVSLVAEGAIGKLLHIQCSVGQYLPDWRPGIDYRKSVTARSELGGGALLELSHEIDLAIWVAGPVESVSARIERVGELEIDVDDCAELSLSFVSGARGTIRLNLLERMPRRIVQITGSAASLEWDYFADALRVGNATAGWRPIDTPKLTDRNDMYVDELKSFLDCIASTSAPIIDGAAGRRVLSVIDAARRSHQKNQSRVLVA